MISRHWDNRESFEIREASNTLDRDYRQLKKICKRDRKTPLADITAKLNEQRNFQVFKRTVRRRLRDHGFSLEVYRKKVVIN